MYEPWYVRVSTTEVDALGDPPEGMPEEGTALWESMRAQAAQNAAVHVWGTGMWEPVICTNLSGSKVVSHPDGILLTIRSVPSEAGRIPAVAIAERITACVNFCADVDVGSLPPLSDLLNELQALRSDERRAEIASWFQPVTPAPGRKKRRRKRGETTG